jgi:ADP-ribosylglycohydrolase
MSALDNAPSLSSKIRGCFLAGLIGDAMGEPAEDKTFQQIADTYGEINDFEGAGTDDTAVRLILIDAIVSSGGHPRVDDFGAAFLRAKSVSYHLWWVPVVNMFHRLEAGLALPADVGWGNMHSSSSAMAIVPLGILNAGDPRRAAQETYEVAGLLHAGPTGFSRDAACAMAAATAAAMTPRATVDRIIQASTAFLLPTSARVMRDEIASTLDLVRTAGGYPAFRAAYYQRGLREHVADPRETVPVALALFELAKGDPNQAILMGANFGRDADTIATMAGGLAGAYRGVEALRAEWVAKAEAGAGARYSELAERFIALLATRRDEARASAEILDRLLQTV